MSTNSLLRKWRRHTGQGTWGLLGDSVKSISELSNLRGREGEVFIYQLPSLAKGQAQLSQLFSTSILSPMWVELKETSWIESSSSLQEEAIRVPGTVKRQVAIASIPLHCVTRQPSSALCGTKIHSIHFEEQIWRTVKSVTPV